MEQIAEVFAKQQASRARLAAEPAKARLARIRRILEWTEAHAVDVRQACWDDFKKPAAEVDISELYAVYGEARHALKHLKSWMKPKGVSPTLAMATTRSKIHYEPKGVVLIVSPWNYPFNLTLCPLISAIAAGNAVMLKPSEMTPHVSALLARMLGELFPSDEVALFEGDVTVAQQLLALPFDHIFFTGSPKIGKVVMKAAAENLSGVTLELGGKSPVVIDESAHVEDAAAKVIWGKFLNCGQTCIAPDYVMVHQSRKGEFVAAAKAQIEKLYGRQPAERKASKDYARIVNLQHFGRLERMFAASVAAGATVAAGGAFDPADRFIDPTLLVDPPADSPVMQEEVFGPLLPIVTFTKLDEALAEIRRGPKPLALYVFGDRKVANKVIAETSSGGACVNDVALHFLHLNLPFGGVGNSGLGNSHGFYGFKAFSHEKAVLRHNRFSLLKKMAPPYTGTARRLIDLTLKYF